jgi:hypothetical protein
MMHGFWNVRKCYVVFNFVSHTPTLSRIVIRSQGIFTCYQLVVGHNFIKWHRGSNSCATLAEETEHSFYQQGIGNLASRYNKHFAFVEDYVEK